MGASWRREALLWAASPCAQGSGHENHLVAIAHVVQLSIQAPIVASARRTFQLFEVMWIGPGIDEIVERDADA